LALFGHFQGEIALEKELLGKGNLGDQKVKGDENYYDKCEKIIWFKNYVQIENKKLIVILFHLNSII
jgi:hypothetical protein